MSIARELADVLEAYLGRAEPTIHTALPPLHLGGGADVLEFRASKWGGTVYVSAGASLHGKSELMLCARVPAPELPRILSRLAAASLQRAFVDGGTVPLGDGPWPGLLFSSVGAVPPLNVNGRNTSFLLAMATNARELTLCRSQGVPSVVALLQRAGAFPFSDIGRTEVAGIDEVEPDHSGLSGGGRAGLDAVVNEQFHEIDHLTRRVLAEDVPILARCYDNLSSFSQRGLLVELLQNHGEACLQPLWRAFLREALESHWGKNSATHTALVMAICRLEENEDTFDTRYWDDLEVALRRARELVA